MNYYYPGPNGVPFYSPPPPTPQQIEKNELRRVAGFVGAIMLLSAVTLQFTYSIVVSLLSVFGFLSPDAIRMEQLGLSNTAFLCVYACIYALAMGLPLTLLIGRKSLFRHSFHKDSLSAGRLFLYVIAAVGGCMFANIVTSIFMTFWESWGFPVPTPPEMMESTPISLILNLFVIAVLPAILEEALFRGCVLRVLRPYGNGLAIVVSSVLFSLMHGNIRQIPFALIVGLILGWLYVASNSLWLPILVHFVNNALSVIMDYCSSFMSDGATSIFYTGIIYGLSVIGGIALLILFVLGTLRAKENPHRSTLRVSERVGVLFNSPAFVISVLVFVGLAALELMV